MPEHASGTRRLRRAPDHPGPQLLETSGAADAVGIAAALGAAGFELDLVACVVDAEAGPELLRSAAAAAAAAADAAAAAGEESGGGAGAGGERDVAAVALSQVRACRRRRAPAPAPSAAAHAPIRPVRCPLHPPRCALVPRPVHRDFAPWQLRAADLVILNKARPAWLGI
jgi:G3E family GTPase